MKKSFAIISLAMGLVATQAQNYYELSFTGQVDKGSTSLGTATFSIFGLGANYSGPASEVLITSFPNDINALVPAPVNATTWDQQIENSFTVVNGILTSADFWAQQTVGGLAYGYQLYLNGESPFHFNYLNIDGTDSSNVWADSGTGPTGLVGLGSEVVSSPTPEPSTIAMVGLGIAGLAAGRRKL